MPILDFDCVLITDRKQILDRDLLWVLEQALDGGIKAIQLREKDLEGTKLFFLAENIRRVTRAYGARLFINDRIDVALATDADGVQLGQSSIPVEAARKLLGAEKMIGASTHSLEEAQEAAQSGADFVFFGPVYFTASKANYGLPQGLAMLKKIVEKIALPVYAIGGIKPENIVEVMRTGIRGVALISAIMSAHNPSEATGKILGLLRR